MLIGPQDPVPANPAQDVTLRELVRTSTGGSSVRLRVSNAFGTAPLIILGIDLARALSPGSSRIDPATSHHVLFNGARSVTIPAGAEYLSDPVPMRMSALSTLAVSMHFNGLPEKQTGHPGSRATSYVAPGDRLSAVELSGAKTVDHWYFLSEVDVGGATPAIAVLGDSIVDGHGVASNSNERWTDFLIERLKTAPATRGVAVLNVGIGSNCLVEACVAPSAVSRFSRDVLERSGVKYVIILEGLNDLGMLTRDAPATPEAHQALVRRMVNALAQMVERAHERGVKVIGGTIMPYGGSGYYHPDAANEADRQAVNAWIRAPGHCDAVIDFDALMRDPAHPNRLRKEFDSGDGLHPSDEGYRMMGKAVPLSLFPKAVGR